MSETVLTAAPAPRIETLHPSLALRARFGSLSVSWGTAAFLVDLGMLFLAAAATELGARAGAAPSPSAPMTVAFLGLCAALYHARGLYAPRLVPDLLEESKAVLAATGVAGMAVLTFLVVTNLDDPASLGAGGELRLWLFAAAYVVAGRVAMTFSQANARRRGEAVSPTLIVGSGPLAKLVARRLVDRSDLGLLPIGFVEAGASPSRSASDEVLPIPVLGSIDELDVLARRFEATQVVVTASGGMVDASLLPTIQRCEDAGIGVAYVPGVYEKFGRRIRVEHIGALPLITSRAPDPAGWQYGVKYALDRVVAGVILLALLPVLAACAAAVYLSMGRPILFRQGRVSIGGEEIGVLKFRSMRLADTTQTFTPKEGTAPGGVEGEDRRTPVGTFLRKTSLDELPQLFNVLLGEMSLVGPRPERPEYVRQFNESVHRYTERHRVKAGITGWSQVNGLRGQTSIADRAEWDNWYIENFSLWLDVKILFLTVFAVLRYARQGE